MRRLSFRNSRPVALAAAAVAAAAAAGCGGSGGAGTSAGTAAPGSRTVTVPTKPVTLKGLTSGSPDQIANQRRQIRQFEAKYPTINVDLKVVPYSSRDTAVRAAIAGKTDLQFMVGFPGAAAASFQSGLEPLDGYITSQERKDWAVLASSKSPDGKVYNVPDTSYAYVFAYNKKLFEQVGAAPPTTWGDMLGLCKKFSSAGITPIAAGWKDGYYLEGFYYVFGDQVLDKAKANQLSQLDLPLNGADMKKPLQDVQALDEAGCFGEGAEDRLYYDDLRNQFASGKAAMVLEPAGGGPVEKGGLYPEQLGATNVGVFPPPQVPGSAYTRILDYGPNDGTSVARWASQEQKDAAWLYIRYRMSPEAQTANWTSFQQLPAVRNVRLTTDYEPTKKVLEWIKWPDNYTIYTSIPSEVNGVIEKQAVPFMTGSLSLDALADQMQQSLDLAKPKLTR